MHWFTLFNIHPNITTAFTGANFIKFYGYPTAINDRREGRNSLCGWHSEWAVCRTLFAAWIQQPYRQFSIHRNKVSNSGELYHTGGEKNQLTLGERNTHSRRLSERRNIRGRRNPCCSSPESRTKRLPVTCCSVPPGNVHSLTYTRSRTNNRPPLQSLEILKEHTRSIETEGTWG